MKKHNVDTSSMTLSKEDALWGYKIVFSSESLQYKETLDVHYSQYFPPLEKKLFEKIAVINFLNLKSKKNLEILDISTGCGHFITLANSLGHNCKGTEIPESIKILQSLYNHYSIDVMPLVIKKQTPILFQNKFNLITSLRTVFDEGWEKQDWIFFKENLLDFLLPNGEVFLKTNIKAIPTNYANSSQILGTPISGWNTLTYLIKK